MWVYPAGTLSLDGSRVALYTRAMQPNPSITDPQTYEEIWDSESLYFYYTILYKEYDVNADLKGSRGGAAGGGRSGGG